MANSIILAIVATMAFTANANASDSGAKKVSTATEQESAEEEPKPDSEALLRQAMEHLASKRRAGVEREEADQTANQVALDDSRTKTVELLIGEMVSIPGCSYALGRTEVTQAQWEGITGLNPSRFKYPDHPVESVSWDEVNSFIETLNAVGIVKQRGIHFRLPSPEEWEYACRAGSTGSYGLLENGKEGTVEEMAWYIPNSDNGGMTHPVGKKKPNVWGLYDMHGNVKEWTSAMSYDYVVTCGGSYACWAYDCTSRSKESASRQFKFPTIGFRLCADGISMSK